MPRRPFQLLPSLLCVVLLLYAAGAAALDPSKSFHHYVRDAWSIEQGLPQISALAIAQDHHGYLWVGTQAGVARFDGHRFVAYNPENTPELPGGFISDLLHDPQGRLWIATYKGLAVRENGRFRRVPLLVDGVEQAVNLVRLARDAEGRLLASAGDAVHVVDGDRLRPLHALDGPAYALFVEGEAMWVGSRGGAWQIDAGGERRFVPLPPTAASAVVMNLLRAQQRLWAGTSQGLFHFDGERWRRYTTDPNLARAPIEAMLEDRDGNLWVAELTHLARLRDGRPHERIEFADAGLAVRKLFEDREGNLWFGSQWLGVSRLRNGWTHRYSLREGLHTQLLWSVAEAGDGSLWVGTDDGLSRFEDGRFTRVVPGSALPHPNAYTLLAEPDRLWIGTRRGLAVFADGAVVRPAEFDVLAAAQINGLLRDRHGVLWLATTAGLYRHADGALQQLGEAEGLADPRIRVLREAADGRLLVGTHAGLYVHEHGRLHQIGVEHGLPPGLDVTSIHELPGGALVLGSLTEKVYLFDGERWTQFGREQGMPANAAFFLASDTEHLWIGGIRGIQRAPLVDLFDVAAGRASRVRGEMLLNERGDRRGGQKGYCCNGAGNAKGLHLGDRLWAPTRDGLVALSMRDVRFPSRAPNTLVERMRVAGQWHDVNDTFDTTLAAGARDLGFEFTGISFHDPRSVSFRYRLLGYHDDWREPDEAGQRIVGYTNLPPGEYRFEVQASSVGDVWSDPTALSFSIAPLFRETRAFDALLVLAVALLALAGWRWQRRRYLGRSRELEALVQQRTEALATANERLREASHTDPLTGLRNRRYLAMQIPKDLAFYSRELRRGGSIGQVIVFAVADIDHFKRINDAYGHGAGDRVLQQFAQCLMRCVRTGDYVARWGGEEFVLVFRPTPPDHVPLLGERVRAAVASHPFDIGTDTPLSVTCSLGLVEYPLFVDAQDSLSWEQLMELADRALYHVKRSGRDGWAEYRPAPGVDVARVLELLRADEATFAASDDLRLVGSCAGNAPAGFPPVLQPA